MRDVVDRQVETTQHLRPHFDPDFRVARTGQPDLAHAEVQQIVADALRKALQCGFRKRPGDFDLAHHVRVLELVDDRLFHVRREGRNARECRLDIGQRLRHIEAFLEVNLHFGQAGICNRVDALHVVEEAHLGFDRLDEAVLDVFGARTWPLRGDDDEVERERGDNLPVEFRHAEHAEQQHQHHQQVARDAVRREERDDAAPLAVHCLTDTREPGPASRSWVVTMRSPSAIDDSPALRISASLPA